MERLYRLNPEQHTVPKTAYAAVTEFYKHTDRWSSGQWDNTPELLIRLSASLPASELDLFEKWVMNPSGIKQPHPEVVKCPLPEDEKVELLVSSDR